MWLRNPLAYACANKCACAVYIFKLQTSGRWDVWSVCTCMCVCLHVCVVWMCAVELRWMQAKASWILSFHLSCSQAQRGSWDANTAALSAQSRTVYDTHTPTNTDTHTLPLNNTQTH